MRKTGFVVILVAVVASLFCGSVNAANKTSFVLSPMKERIVLNPGDSFRGGFKISNPVSSEDSFEYEIKIKPFYVNEDYVSVFNQASDLTMIADWIELESSTTGVLEPNEVTNISFKINVPDNAPAGGQYAAIIVSSRPEAGNGGINSAGISESIAIAHTVFAEVTGTLIKQGEFVETSVPSFLLSGDLKGTAAIKNTGNVHGIAKYTMRVFPLFSDEELYTNEENPDEDIILPNRTFYNETVMPNTPSFGIFNVIYKVEFEGVTKEISKMVIICPIWLLFIVVFGVILLVFWLVFRSIKRRK